MAEKKRKSATTPVGPPTKKNKKSVASEPAPSTVTDPVANLSANEAVAKSRSSRKRASDFLEDSTSLPADLSAIESKMNGHSATRSGTATNGARNDHADAAGEDVNVISGQEENQSQDDDVSEGEDQGALLLAGFDSDSDDPAEDQGDLSKTQPIPHFKKTSKKLKQAKEKGSNGPGTVYVGRIPHGFYEHQMRDYFTQFGNISRLRISRNKRTGASKHFAFIEFESDEVAKIVAETMDNYLMFGHILKCKYAPSDSLHPDVWKGANKKFRKIPHDKLQRQRLEAPKTQEQWTKKNEKEQKRRLQKAAKMKAIGYEYVVPQLTDPADAIEQKKLEQVQAQAASRITDERKQDTVEAPPPVPADEVALKEGKKPKKRKTASGSNDKLTEGNLDARNAGPAAESAKKAQNKADKDNRSAAKRSRHESLNGTNGKKSKLSRHESANESVITESSNNQYDGLSSIPVGIEAAPDSVTDASIQPDPDQISNIFTHAGVADSVLKDRRKDRKRSRAAGKVVKDSTEKAVSDLAPGAAGREKEEKAKEQREKQVKGILKKSKKQQDD